MDAVIRRALPADARALTRVAHAAKRHWKYPEDWIGLTPAKSLTLRPLAVPDSVFADFLRGCVDGDGSVVVYADWYHTDKNERYVYERLYVTLVSGSWRFLDWIRSTVHRLISLKGSISAR